MEKYLAKCQPVVINVDEQTASSSVQGPPAKVLKQSTLQVLSTSAVKQHEIDLSVTRYFIATNTPFNAASNRHLKSLVQKFRPGTTIPERRKISGELLDEVYDQEKQKVKQQVQKAHVTLAIYGWSTLTNDPVLGISFYKSGVCYLVNTINTSGEPHTSDYLVQVVKDQIAYVEDEFGVKVTSFVTDNAANMNFMRREIRQDLDGVFHTYGCHAHIANLLSKDILNQRDIKPLLSKVMAVLKFLRNSHACSAELKEKKINRPPAACETRWNSYIDVLEYFQKNWAQLADVVNNNCRSSEPVFRYMEEISLKRSIEDILEFLEAISQMLDDLQKDTCTLSDSFQLWNSVISAAPIEYSEFVAKRAEMALIPLVFAANLLDHRHHGNMLTPLETAKAVEYIKEVAGEEMLPELTKYMGKTSPYTEYLFGEGYKKVEPSAWWSSGSKLGFDQNSLTSRRH